MIVIKIHLIKVQHLRIIQVNKMNLQNFDLINHNNKIKRIIKNTRIAQISM